MSPIFPFRNVSKNLNGTKQLNFHMSDVKEST